ncbi:bifunctional Protein kinase-like domain superfamily/Protein kinase domain/Serine-threonine-protein kinase [Babesia duncani]|uniref:non-specific serine/threonine protein kinase n=1 Tax=Babesia duncani TaxID=323732 RepID=A0AAD9UPS2_9APIC|nr:bifunctional Protein kinase-like domain superfamily/Protein kinase domain/Serine-threonine-protein kinase [Babesia duncani]
MGTLESRGCTPYYSKIAEYYLLQNMAIMCMHNGIYLCDNNKSKDENAQYVFDLTLESNGQFFNAEKISTNQHNINKYRDYLFMDIRNDVRKTTCAINLKYYDKENNKDGIDGMRKSHPSMHLDGKMSQKEMILVGIYLALSLCGLCSLIQVIIEYIRGCRCRICRGELKTVKNIAKGTSIRVELATVINPISKLEVNVVLKFIPVSSTYDITIRREERERMMALDHKGILHCFGDLVHKEYNWNPFQKTQMFLVLVTEYCKLGNLADLIQNTYEKFTNDYIIDLFKQICSALEYIHENNVLHRDIKSPNIFMSDFNSIRLGDFGLSSFSQGLEFKGKKHYKILKVHRGSFDQRDSSNSHQYSLESSITYNTSNTILDSMPVGTDCYMAPEVIKYSLYSEASDIWALGCVLYEMCTGTFMWEIEFQLGREPERLPQLLSQMPITTPVCVKSLLKEMLSEDYSKRPSAMQILKTKTLEINKEMVNIINA